MFPGDVPHPLGSDEHERVRERLVAELQALGVEPVVEEHAVARHGVIGLVKNVVVPPARRTEKGAVLLCAHYDSVAAGPGASDDGAGVAALLEVVRALRSGPVDAARPWMLLLDDGEEMGLLGAEAFVRASEWRGDVGVVVNLEARGTCGASRMFETSPGNAELVAVLARSLPHPSASSVSYEIYKRMPNDTDLTVFKEARIPGINFAFVGGGRRYHTRFDRRDELARETLQHHGENALASARELCAHAGELASDGDAVYTDVLGLFLVRWPAGAAVWIAVALLTAVAWVARGALRARRAGWPAIAAGAALLPLATLVAAALVLAFDEIVVRSHPGTYPWPPESAAARLAIALAAMAATSIAATTFARRSNATSRYDGDVALAVVVGLVLVETLLGVLVAAFVPGATYAFVLPIAAALPFVARSPRVAAFALSAVQALLLFPLLAGIEEVFEMRTVVVPACAAIAAGWALVAAPLAVAWCGATRRAASTAALLFGAAAVACVLAIARTSPNSTREPEPVFVAHVERAGAASASLLARSSGSRPFDAWIDARGFVAAPAQAFPWWGRSPRARELATPPLALAPPTADVLARETKDGVRRVRVELRSQRGARHLVIELPRGVALVSARGAGHEAALASPMRGAADLVGFGAAKVEVELAIEGTNDVELDLLDVDSPRAEATALLELVRTLPDGYEPRGEGAVVVAATRVKL